MGTEHIVTFLSESLFTVGVFFFFFIYALWRGRYALVNLILGLYFALLISLYFPYYQTLKDNFGDSPIIPIILFILFTILGVRLFRRHIPGDDYERTFQSFAQKILLTTAATVLVMAYSFHILPLTDIVHTSSFFQQLFAPAEYFFWWLILPIIILFFA